MVGDMITEEALPTYENWLMEVEGVDIWAKWLGTMGSSMDKWRKSSWRLTE
jgi:hypothetical protein